MLQDITAGCWLSDLKKSSYWPTSEKNK